MMKTCRRGGMGESTTAVVDVQDCNRAIDSLLAVNGDFSKG
jgi:hypothetical protein